MIIKCEEYECYWYMTEFYLFVFFFLTFNHLLHLIELAVWYGVMDKRHGAEVVFNDEFNFFIRCLPMDMRVRYLDLWIKLPWYVALNELVRILHSTQIIFISVLISVLRAIAFLFL